MPTLSPRMCSTAGLLAVVMTAVPFLRAAELPNRLRSGSELSTRSELPQGAPRRVQMSQPVGDVSGNAELGLMSLVLAPSAQQTAALNQLLADQQNQASPRYHKWLTPAQFGASFGVSDQDLQVLRNWLVSQGFSVVGVSPSRNLIQFTGTAAAAQTAFATHFGRFQRNGQTFFSNTSAPSIPSAFRDVVSGVQGLNGYRLQPHPLKRVVTPAELHSGASSDLTGTDNTGAIVHELVPYDVRQIYNANALVSSGYNGAGVTIAVIGQTAVNLAQLADFQTLTGQTVKPPTLTLVPNSGVATVYSGDESESEADLEFSGGVAPGATINFVYTGDGSGSIKYPDVITALEYAITSNAGQIITMSYGECEVAEGVASIYTVEPFLRQASAQGQTFLNSSGDSGAAACDASTQSIAYDGAQVSYPASSPYATGVGGTTLNDNPSSMYWSATNNSQRGSALSYIPEAVWNESGGSDGVLYASGGGASIIFSKPSWQTGSYVPADGVRDVPDISFSAAGHDPYFFCTADTTYTSTANGKTYTGQCTATTVSALAVAGTSLASPSFAGLLAIAEQANGGGSLGNINPLLYALSSANRSAFHSVLGGGNQVPCLAGTTGCVNGVVGYLANIEYSLATGLGSMDIGTFSSTLAASASANATTPTLVATLASQTTTAATFTITVGTTNGGSTPTGTITVAVDGGTSSTLTLASGTYSYTLATSSLAAGTHTLTISYSGDATHTSATTSITFVTGAPAGTFTLSVTPSSLTVASGAAGTSSVTLGSVNYSGLVLYSISPASGSTAASGCFIGGNGDITSSGNTVFLDTSITAGKSVTASFTYQPSASSCSGTALNQTSTHGVLTAQTGSGLPSHPWSAFAVCGFFLGGIALRRRRALAGGLLAVSITIAALGTAGCGSGTTPLSTTTNPVSSSGTYNYVITAQSYPNAAVVATTNFTVIIQ